MSRTGNERGRFRNAVNKENGENPKIMKYFRRDRNAIERDLVWRGKGARRPRSRMASDAGEGQ